jgi:hypothetical protein
MERIEHYKGFLIQAFERAAGCWQAKISKLDGTKVTTVHPPQQFSSITTSGDDISADAAIKRAKEAIDGGGMK